MLLNDNLESKVEPFLTIYQELKGAFKWKADKKVLMLVSSMYVINGRAFDLERFNEISKHIQTQVGAFNTLRSSSERFSIAAMLDIKCDEPEVGFQSYLDLYELLVSGGFRRGMFTYIAAVVLFSSNVAPTNYEEIGAKAQDVYKAMKKEHRFLTSQDDYPLSVLLATRNEEISILMERVEGYYHQLHQLGFRKGNDLQFLSHILSLVPEGNATQLSQRCLDIYETITTLWKKPKSLLYPTIGMLALTDEGQLNLKEVMVIAERLNSEKDFKWDKDLNFMFAVNLLISEKMEDPTVSNTGMMTTIEVILQAQQAAMVASMTAVSAAAATSSSS